MTFVCSFVKRIARRSGRLLAVGLATLLAAAPAARAQVVPGLPYSASVQAHLQSWTIDENDRETTISQVVVPVGVFLPVSDGIEVRLSTAYVSLSRDRPDADETESVSGAADLKLQASAAVADRRLLLGAIMNLPTGKGDLTSADQDVVLAFVAPDLSVRANRFGEGFNIGGTVSYAYPASPTSVLGLGAAFVSRGAYTTSFPGIAAEFDFNPGYEATLTGAWIYSQRNTRFRLATSYTRHGIEQANDVDIFQLGPRLAVDLSYTRAFSDGQGTATFQVQELYRFKNSSGLSGTFDTELLNTNGNYLVLITELGFQPTDALRFGFDVGGRFIGKNEQSVGNASVFEAGLDLTAYTGESVGVGLGFRGIVGSGTGLDGADRSIAGLEGTARLSFQF